MTVGYTLAALFGMVAGMILGVGMGYEVDRHATVAETPDVDAREGT